MPSTHQKTSGDTQAPTQIGYPLNPVMGWRNRVRDYTPLIGEENQANLDALRDVVYGMALQGADERDIAEYFGFERHLVKAQLGPVIQMARAELRLILKANQIDTALNNKLPLSKIGPASSSPTSATMCRPPTSAAVTTAAST